MEILASDLVERMKYNVALGRIIELEQTIRELKFTIEALQTAIASDYSQTAIAEAKRLGIYA